MGLATYERRHGWKGHLENVSTEGTTLANYQHPDWDEEPEVGGYVHGLVMAVAPGSATVKFGRYTATLLPADAVWIQHKLLEILKPGDIVYLKIVTLGSEGKARVSLEQDSGTQGALIAIDNATGEIKAMVGGRDFESKFDRATQALRQVGSSFDLWLSRRHRSGSKAGRHHPRCACDLSDRLRPYTPHNYDEKFEGTITLRRALAQSRNIPALKLADRVGIRTVIDYAHRFGIT